MKKTQQKEVFSMSTFRKATEVDIPAITAIYDHTHDLEERGETTIGWIRGVYPTEETAREALDADDLFVMEEDGAVVAAARINQAQVDCYARAQWSFDAAPEQVMVLHTLVVEPAQKGHGFGPQFVQFYEDYARAHGCPVLRIDTNARNQAARRLYARLGYREADIVHCDFNAIRGIDLVCLEKKLEWRVFYGKNFWATRGRGKPGVEISLGHRFRWGDADWRALSVYACAKGLVLDLAKHVPAEDVRRFVGTWAPLEEAGLTPEQAEQALMESPFHDSFHAELLVNGRALRGEGGSGFAWGPDAEQDAAERAVLAHYALDPAEHWQLWRLHFPWKRRQAVKTLTLTLTADPVWRPGPQFTAQPGQTVSFTHPASGTNHMLTVLALTPETLDVSGLPDFQEYPAHCLRLDYTVSPELLPDAVQVRDTAPSDPPRLKSPENISGEIPAGGAACIGIIGGEDGPTSIFVTGSAPSGHRTAYSCLHFEEPERVAWRLRFSFVPCGEISEKMI